MKFFWWSEPSVMVHMRLFSTLTEGGYMEHYNNHADIIAELTLDGFHEISIHTAKALGLPM